MGKTIRVVSYEADGSFRVAMKLGLKRPVQGNSPEEARAWVEKLLVPHVRGNERYTVEWERDGMPEGYMVSTSLDAGKDGGV